MKKETVRVKMEEKKRRNREGGSEQADSAQQSKHTAGLQREEASGEGATSLSLLAPPSPSHSASQPACLPTAAPQ